MLKNLTNMLRDDEGQGLVEYALIIALISVVAIVALQLIGTRASTKLSAAGASLT